MNHWALFKRSWSILWRHRALWVLGFLPALVGWVFALLATPAASATAVDDAERLLRNLRDPSAFVGPSLVIGIISQLVVAVVAAFADGGMISMVNAVAAGRSPTLGSGLTAASNRLVPLIVARLLLVLPAIAVGALVSASAISSAFTSFRSPDDVMSAFGSITGLAGLSILISLLVAAVNIGADRAIMLEDMAPIQAIVRGWKLLWGRFADYFAIGLIFLLLAIAIGALFVCVLAPVMFAGLNLSLSQLRPGASLFAFQAIGPTVLIVGLLGAVFSGLASVFASSVWTLAYREWLASLPSASAGQ